MASYLAQRACVHLVSAVSYPGLVFISGPTYLVSLIQLQLKLPQVTKAIAQCKKITTHFHHSRKSSYIFKQNQKSLDKVHALIQEVTTQWNLSYYMVSRILEQTTTTLHYTI